MPQSYHRVEVRYTAVFKDAKGNVTLRLLSLVMFGQNCSNLHKLEYKRHRRYLSSNIRVSFESRYGMCCLPRWSVSAEITFPSAESDWLIFLLSCKRCPVAPDNLTRSDPARSTKLSLPT